MNIISAEGAFKINKNKTFLNVVFNAVFNVVFIKYNTASNLQIELKLLTTFEIFDRKFKFLNLKLVSAIPRFLPPFPTIYEKSSLKALSKIMILM